MKPERWFVTVPVAPLRAQPDDRSELVSELIAGEPVVVEEEGSRPWVRVQALRDGYRGWCDRKQLHAGDEAGGLRTFLPAEPWKRSSDGARIHLPWGATVYELGSGTYALGAHRLQRTVAEQPLPHCPAALAELWRGVPYRWGGKTHFGVDCSGLVQQVFAALGVMLPRDAADQIHCGTDVPPESRQKGDLAFFHNAEGRVIHVGICLRREALLHASGEVREDDLVAEGIRHRESGELTHKLSGIRRISFAV